MIEIEKNIPLPPERHCKYPFEKLEIGDSFFICGGKIGSISSSKGQFIKTTAIGKDRQFTCRQIEGGVRVWRIK
jgi:hypothetical protein